VKGWHSSVKPELRELIERACTEKQITAFKLKSHGAGNRRIALALDIDESTVRGLLNRGTRRIREELAAQRGIFQ
jgi:DNA-binding CsgD family transcriptional regulator